MIEADDWMSDYYDCESVSDIIGTHEHNLAVAKQLIFSLRHQNNELHTIVKTIKDDLTDLMEAPCKPEYLDTLVTKINTNLNKLKL